MNTQRSTLVRTAAASLAAAVLTLAACGGGDEGDEAANPATEAPAAADTGADNGAGITIQSFSFGGVTTVAAGTSVTVTNDDSVPHTVTADDGSFDTGTIQPGDSAQITLDAAGTFTYHCNIHGSMTGSITVTA